MLIHSLYWPFLNGRAKPTTDQAAPTVSKAQPQSEDRQALAAVQWLVAIAVSYLIIAVDDRNLTEPLPAMLIVLSLLSAVLMRRLPDILFEKRLVEPGLLVVDSLLILSAITTSQQLPWDLLILFFFCVFIAAIGENLVQIGVGCVLLSLAFVMFLSPNALDLSTAQPNFLFRIPFMFGISIFYGHLANQVKKEQRRATKIEEVEKLRRQMVCALAHDIKTPLNVIFGHAELLADYSSGDSMPTEKQLSLKCIRENIDRIVKLITEFLDVAKIEASKPQAGPNLVQLNVIAEDAVKQQAVMAREKKLRLRLQLDADVQPSRGDSEQLQRALGNLISNAIKFTPAGGDVTVSSQMLKSGIAIQVKDTGIGIPQEELPRLFSEFQRLKGAESTEGTGLGLFIVKTIVEAHNGTVSVKSETGRGTTFTILLPPASSTAAFREAA